MSAGKRSEHQASELGVSRSSDLGLGFCGLGPGISDVALGSHICSMGPHRIAKHPPIYLGCICWGVPAGDCKAPLTALGVWAAR